MSASGAADARSVEEIMGAGAGVQLSGAPALAATLQGIVAAAPSALGADRATCYVHDADQVVAAVHTTETDPERRAFLERALGLGPAELPILRLQPSQADPLLVVEDVCRHPAIASRLAARLGSGAFLRVRLEHASVQAGGAPTLLGTLFCNYDRPRRFTAAERSAAQGLANLAALSLANAVAGAFWARMQVELLNRIKWRTRVELANAMFEYLEVFHNRQRRHSALGMRTPTEYEILHQTRQPLAS